MTNITQCPSCEARVPISARLVGKKIDCPKCKFRFLVTPESPGTRASRRKPVSDEEFELKLEVDEFDTETRRNEFELSLDTSDFEIPALEDENNVFDEHVIALDDDEDDRALFDDQSRANDELPVEEKKKASSPVRLRTPTPARAEVANDLPVESGEGTSLVDANTWGNFQAFLCDPRANVFTSLFWLLLGWAVARWTPWLGLAAPGIDELVNFTFPLATVVLVGWNLWASARLVYRSGHAMSALPLTLVQILLFTLLFFQIGTHGGAQHYSWKKPPEVLDWAGFSLAHALRATDVIDGIEAYGLRIQNIRNESHLSSLTLILFHLVVTIFFISLFMEWVNRLKRRFASDPGRVAVMRGVGALAALAIGICWIGSAFFSVPRWQWSDIVLWPIDNFLRVLDFSDVFEIYHYRMHQLPFYAWEGSLTLACRFLMAIFIAEMAGRFSVLLRLRFLGGFALGEDDLRELRDSHPENEVRRLAAARLNVLRDAEGERAEQWRRWNSQGTWRAGFALVAAALVTPFILPWSGLPVQELAKTAVGESPWQGARALAALRRMGSAAGKDAVLELERGQSTLPLERRLAIVETWGHLGEPAVESLGKLLLSDSDSQLRQTAVASLERIGPPAAPTLVLGMKSSDPQIQETCRIAIEHGGYDTVQALVDHIDERTAADVVPLLDKLNPYWVRHATTNDNPSFPLVSKARRAGLALSDAWGINAQTRALEKLAECGPLAAAERFRVEPLLSATEPEVQIAALAALSKIRGGGSPLAAQEFLTLSSLLVHPSVSTRTLALDLLSQAKLTPQQEGQLGQQLVLVLSDQDPAFVQRAQVRLLAINPENTELVGALRLNLKAFLPHLSAFLAHREPWARGWAMRILAQLGAAVAEADRPVVARGRFAPPPQPVLVPTLVNNLASIFATGAETERPLAATALREIDRECTHLGPALSSRLGNDAVRRLAGLARDDNVEYRRLALLALGAVDLRSNNTQISAGGPEFNEVAIVDALVSALISEDFLCRELSLSSLARRDATGAYSAAAAKEQFGTARSVAMLLALVRELRPATLPAPSSIPYGAQPTAPPSAPHMVAFLHALRMLGQLGTAAGSAEPDILPLASSNNSHVRVVADEALQRIRGTASLTGITPSGVAQTRIAQLLKRLNSSDEIDRGHAREELASMTIHAGTLHGSLVDLLLSKEGAARDAHAFVVNRFDLSGEMTRNHLFRRPRPIPDLTKTLISLLRTDAEPETRRFAAFALSGGTGKSSLPEIVGLLSEENSAVRCSVFLTLSKLDPAGAQIAELLWQQFSFAAPLRLVPVFKEPDPQIRDCLVNVLQQLSSRGPAVSDLLAKALVNANPLVQGVAREALGKISPTELAAADRSSYRKLLTEAQAALAADDFEKANGFLQACGPSLRKFEWNFLHRLANPMAPRGGFPGGSVRQSFRVEQAVLTFEHGGATFGAAAFSPGMGAGHGRYPDYLVGASGNGEAVLWTLANRQRTSVWKADTGPFRVAIDARTFRVLTVGNQVGLWAGGTTKIDEWPVPKGAKLRGASFNGGGTQAVFAMGNHLRIIYIRKGLGPGAPGSGFLQPVKNDAHTEPASGEVVDFAISADGGTIVAGLKSGMVVTWRLPDNAKPTTRGSHGERIEAFAFDPKTLFIATSGARDTKLWSLGGETSLGVGMRCLAFAHPGQRLMAGDAEGNVTIWSTGSEPELLLVHRVSKSAVRSLATSDDGTLLAATSGDDRIYVLNGSPIAVEGPVGDEGGESLGPSAPAPTGSGVIGPRGPAGPAGPQPMGGPSAGMGGGPLGPSVPGPVAPGFPGRIEPGAVPGPMPGGTHPPGFPGVPGGVVPGAIPGGELPPNAVPGGLPLGGIPNEPDLLFQKTADLVDEIFKREDKDGDGLITRSEGVSLRGTFDTIDTDKSSTLEWEECYQHYRFARTRKK